MGVYHCLIFKKIKFLSGSIKSILRVAFSSRYIFMFSLNFLIFLTNKKRDQLKYLLIGGRLEIRSSSARATNQKAVSIILSGCADAGVAVTKCTDLAYKIP